MIYSIIENNIVVNIAVADHPIANNWIEGSNPIGSTYVNGVFTPPTFVGSKITKISKLEYMSRFTDAELATIYTAAKSSVLVEIWFEKFKLATDIDLSDQRTIDGLNALELAGLIETGRAAEILQ